jgi:PAS domain-containing protein
MWPVLTGFLFAAAVALGILWRRNVAVLRRQAAEQQSAQATQREQHEQLALQIQAQQQAVFNSMVEGVLVLDRTGRV